MSEKTPTQIYGVIGYPVKHSFSPAMHNAAFRALKINAEYRLFEVRPKELEGFLLDPDKIVKDTDNHSVCAGDVIGFNITIPHKVRAKEILEKKFPFDKNVTLIDEQLHYVKVSGAVNTVIRTKNGMKYFNTDAEGFLKSLENDLGFVPKNKKVLIIGCGGAGRAIISALSWKNYELNKIFINDIRPEAVESAKQHFAQFRYVVDKIEFITNEQITNVIKECQLLVNATPIGMKEGDGSIIDKNLLHERLSIYDVVYHRETQLIKDAKTKIPPVPFVDGLGMLHYQGALAFEYLTGVSMHKVFKIMRQALEKELEKCTRQ